MKKIKEFFSHLLKKKKDELATRRRWVAEMEKEVKEVELFIVMLDKENE